MTSEQWKALLSERARHLETIGELTGVRRAGWRSADVRMVQHMERDPDLTKDALRQLLATYWSAVDPLLPQTPGVNSATWTRPASWLERHFPRADRIDLAQQIAGWVISPRYSRKIDVYRIRRRP